MALILNIETSSKNCSVALSKNKETIAVIEKVDTQFIHAEKLHLFVNDLFENSSYQLTDLDAIAVSKGPGSYTGLRIGVSSAKGYCLGLNIPLIALDTLEILARIITIDTGYIIPMIDARRMEVYQGIYSKDYQNIEPIAPLILNENCFKDYKKPLYFIGDGALKFKGLNLNNPNFIFNESILWPSAKNMVLSTFEKFQNKQFEDLAYFEPFYLKEVKIN